MKRTSSRYYSFVYACLYILTLMTGSAFAEYNESKLYQNLPFAMPQVKTPAIPNYNVNLTEFDGKGDGLFDNTQAFKRAIEALAENLGGRLIVPRGIWRTGPIQLKSHIELHLEAGALIKFLPDPNLYSLIQTSYEGLDGVRLMSPIHAHNLTDIAITGSGVIDGSGDAWRPVKRSKMTDNQWQKLLASGGVLSDNQKVWYPSKSYKAGEIQKKQYDIFKYNLSQARQIKDWYRPVMVSIANSQNILLDGPTFQNSPAWNIHLLKSKHIIVRNLTVRNPWYSQNGDGLDLESVKNVLVYNNTFDVGDDAICIKSGKNEDGRKRAMPSENLVIKNNTVYHAHGGFVVGSEMSGGVKNVLFADASFIGTDIGIRFKSTRGRGGVVEKIWIENVDMTDIVKESVSFNMYYGIKEKASENSAPPVDETTPQFKDISIKHIRSINAGSALLVQGLPELKLAGVNVSDTYFSAQKGIEINFAEGINFNRVELDTQAPHAVIIKQASDVNFQAVTLSNSKNVLIDKQTTSKLTFDKDFLKHAIVESSF